MEGESRCDIYLARSGFARGGRGGGDQGTVPCREFGFGFCTRRALRGDQGAILCRGFGFARGAHGGGIRVRYVPCNV